MVTANARWSAAESLIELHCRTSFMDSKYTIMQRSMAPLAETQSLTEVRGEASDPDRGLLAETQSFTKVANEATDDDQQAMANAADWERGDKRPLLFAAAVTASDEIPEFYYDDTRSMSVDSSGALLIASTTMGATMTKTNAMGEADDTD